MIQKALRHINKKYYPKHYFFSPEWIVLGVNNVCNLHCKMCDVGTKNMDSNFAQNLVGTHPLNMPLDLLKKVIDQTAQFFPKAKLGYAFTEPLVYPQLIASLEYAAQKGIHTAVTTNALTLDKKAEQLVNANLKELFISLDGPQEIHNEIRGHKKSFQKAIEGIEKLMTYTNRPKVSVFCVITEWNICYLEEFADFFSKYPIELLGFMHTNFTTKELAHQHNMLWESKYPATDSNIDEISIEAYDLDALWEEINTIKKKHTKLPIVFAPELDTKKDLIDFYKHPELQIGTGCNDVFTNIMIKSDGSVIPSHGRCFNLTVGNIYEDNLKQIWNSSVLSNFRKDLHQSGGLMPACNRCCSAF